MKRAKAVCAHLQQGVMAAATAAVQSSPITTHILDVHRGRPAAAVPTSLSLQRQDGSWELVGSGVTDSDGRCKTLMVGRALKAGTYRLEFDTDAYFKSIQTESFYPFVQIVFRVKAEAEHYHVPLLLSAHGYSTYRGS
eukprot:m.479808 g.479808  ORF g.479808 m.479808 type:complete len:138 (+) comp21609_c0_seq1:46-459(+)